MEINEQKPEKFSLARYIMAVLYRLLLFPVALVSFTVTYLQAVKNELSIAITTYKDSNDVHKVLKRENK